MPTFRRFSQIADFIWSKWEQWIQRLIFQKNPMIHNALSLPKDRQHYHLRMQNGLCITEQWLILIFQSLFLHCFKRCIVLNGAFLITCNRSFSFFKKWTFFVAFEQRIVDRNAVSSNCPLNRESPKHLSGLRIKVFSSTLQHPYGIYRVPQRGLVTCDLDLILIIVSIWSPSMTADLLEYSWLSKSKFLLLNLANHLWITLWAMAPSQ